MNSDELTNAITYILGFAYRGLQFYTQYLIYSVSYHSLSGYASPTSYLLAGRLLCGVIVHALSPVVYSYDFQRCYDNVVTWLMTNRGVVREIEKGHTEQGLPSVTSQTEQWQLVLQTQPIYRFPTTSLRRVSVATTAPSCRSPTRPSFAWYARECYASLNWQTVVVTTTVPPAWKGGSRTRPAALCAGRKTLAHSETRRQRGESRNLR